VEIIAVGFRVRWTLNAESIAMEVTQEVVLQHCFGDIVRVLAENGYDSLGDYGLRGEKGNEVKAPSPTVPIARPAREFGPSSSAGRVRVQVRSISKR
jgi:hypothetical protein